MNKSVFIVTKPLQLIISLLIIEQNFIQETSDLFIVNLFNKADDVFDNLKSKLKNNKKPFSEVFFFETYTSALKAAVKQNHLYFYTYSDVGFTNYLYFIYLKINKPLAKILVYEEGLGSYVSDFYPEGIKKFIFHMIGVGVHHGGSRLTSNIYLFRPDTYKRLFNDSASKAKAINKPIAQFILENEKFLYLLFSYSALNKENKKNAEAVIYLSSWMINEAFIKSFKSCPGDKFIKLHPHLKKTWGDQQLIEISSTIPAEILLIDLAKQYHKVTVYHHETSVELYLDSPKLTFITIKV